MGTGPPEAQSALQVLTWKGLGQSGELGFAICGLRFSV